MRKQVGSHLLDVLIGLFLLSLALIGLDAMLIQTTQQTTSLYYLHVGMQQMQQLHERMLSGSHENHLALWNEQNRTLLPDGKGTLQQSDHVSAFTLFWQQRKQISCKEENVSMRCLALDIPRL